MTLLFATMSAGTLSRREEEQLLKSTKAYALKACDDLVKGACSSFQAPSSLTHTCMLDFAECVEGRTLSVAWACKGKYKLIQDCMYQ